MLSLIPTLPFPWNFQLSYAIENNNKVYGCQKYNANIFTTCIISLLAFQKLCWQTVKGSLKWPDTVSYDQMIMELGVRNLQV